MKLRIHLAALAALTGAASAQPPTSVIPGDGISGEQIGRTLLQPKFCGTPAPDGYACALLRYEDAKGRDALVSNTQIADPFYRPVIAAAPGKKAGDPVELTVLSPQGCAIHTTAKAAQLVSVPDAKKRMHRVIVRSIVGYQDNQSLPVGYGQKVERALFAKPTASGCPEAKN